jgi:large subunit ribosomal protein L24
MVITGADKGQTGRVLRVLTTREKVVVEGINRVWKHVRPSQRHPRAGASIWTPRST